MLPYNKGKDNVVADGLSRLAVIFVFWVLGFVYFLVAICFFVSFFHKLLCLLFSVGMTLAVTTK